MNKKFHPNIDIAASRKLCEPVYNRIIEDFNKLQKKDPIGPITIVMLLALNYYTDHEGVELFCSFLKESCKDIRKDQQLQNKKKIPQERKKHDRT